MVVASTKIMRNVRVTWTGETEEFCLETRHIQKLLESCIEL